MKALIVGGVEDHVHVLLSIPPTLAVAKSIQLLKGNSSKWIHDTFKEHWNFDWQEGYGAFSIGISGVEDTTNYTGPGRAPSEDDLQGRGGGVPEEARHGIRGTRLGMIRSTSNLKGLCRPWRGWNRPVMAVVPSVETLGYSRDVPPGQGLPPRARGFCPGGTP